MKNYSTERTKNMLRLNTVDIAFMTGLLTGHGDFKKNLHKLNISSNSHCRFCGETESAEHILCGYEAFSKLRNVFFGRDEIELNTLATIKFQDFCMFGKRILERMSKVPHG